MCVCVVSMCSCKVCLWVCRFTCKCVSLYGGWWSVLNMLLHHSSCHVLRQGVSLNWELVNCLDKLDRELLEIHPAPLIFHQHCIHLPPPLTSHQHCIHLPPLLTSHQHWGCRCTLPHCASTWVLRINSDLCTYTTNSLSIYLSLWPVKWWVSVNHISQHTTNIP